MADTHSKYDVVFRSEGLDGQQVIVARLDGREALSELYEHTLVVASRHEQLISFAQVEAMMHAPAYLAFGGDEEHKVHGVVRSVEMLPASAATDVRYEVRFVPRLWYATQTAGSWVYLDMSVPEMVRDVLQSTGLHEGDDFEFRLTDRYAKREYTLQYRETDFAFVSRLLEHEGMFFFWEHATGRDRLVIADHNNAFLELADHESVPFDPRAGMTDLAEAVFAASRLRQSVARHLVVKDYNYRTPSLALRTGLEVDATGRGTLVRYGDHFKDLAAARRVARLRAEEIFARRERYTFRSRVRGLRAGHRFTLVDHFMDDFLQPYAVTSVEHHAAQYGLEEGRNAGPIAYHNVATAIPHAVAFRPALKTPRPTVPGFTQAKVDGRVAEDGSAPIDAEGRYKVASVCDSTRATTNHASHWVRRAQPYSGQDYGMHFPLHVGTDVMLSHAEGDPDRPIIVGTAPNPENATPVAAVDAQRSRIRTRSNLVMGWHDRRGDAPRK